MRSAFARAALVAVVLTAGACADGGAGPDLTSTPPAPAPATTTATTTATVAPSPTADATLGLGPDDEPSETPGEAGSTPFAPPAPSCPSPDGPIEAPALAASAGPTTVAMTMGSDTAMTCSMAGSNDREHRDPATPLAVTAGGTLRVWLPEGWRFLWWEGWDRAGEGVNVILGGETLDRPGWIDIPVPSRTGASYVGIEAWAIRSDGRVVAQVMGSVLVVVP
jgi:hypothetical protein